MPPSAITRIEIRAGHCPGGPVIAPVPDAWQAVTGVVPSAGRWVLAETPRTGVPVIARREPGAGVRWVSLVTGQVLPWVPDRWQSLPVSAGPETVR